MLNITDAAHFQFSYSERNIKQIIGLKCTNACWQATNAFIFKIFITFVCAVWHYVDVVSSVKHSSLTGIYWILVCLLNSVTKYLWWHVRFYSFVFTRNQIFFYTIHCFTFHWHLIEIWESFESNVIFIYRSVWNIEESIRMTWKQFRYIRLASLKLMQISL